MQPFECKYFDWDTRSTDPLYDWVYGNFSDLGCSENATSVYTITKDLILNGIKANFKRIFFLESGMDISHPGDYELGVRMYKSKLLNGGIGEFAAKARDLDFWVRAKLEFKEDDLVIEVTNNQEMVQSEMYKINSSILYSQKYEDIMEYYLERADDSEGEGIGIALIIILLKSMNVNLYSFQIFNLDGLTRASVEIPKICLRNLGKKEGKMRTI